MAVALHAHNYNTHAAKNTQQKKAKQEQQLPQRFTLRTDDAELVASLTARAPSASQSDHSQMNGAASTTCVWFPT